MSEGGRGRDKEEKEEEERGSRRARQSKRRKSEHKRGRAKGERGRRNTTTAGGAAGGAGAKGSTGQERGRRGWGRENESGRATPLPHLSTPRWRSYIWPRLTPGLPQATGYATVPFGPAPHPLPPRCFRSPMNCWCPGGNGVRGASGWRACHLSAALPPRCSKIASYCYTLTLASRCVQRSHCAVGKGSFRCVQRSHCAVGKGLFRRFPLLPWTAC